MKFGTMCVACACGTARLDCDMDVVHDMVSGRCMPWSALAAYRAQARGSPRPLHARIAFYSSEFSLPLPAYLIHTKTCAPMQARCRALMRRTCWALLWRCQRRYVPLLAHEQRMTRSAYAVRLTSACTSSAARGRWRPCTGCSAVIGVSRRKVCRCRATCLLVPESACMSAWAGGLRVRGCVAAQGSWRRVTCCVRSCLRRSSCNTLCCKCKAPSCPVRSRPQRLQHGDSGMLCSAHISALAGLDVFTQTQSQCAACLLSLRSGHHPRPHVSTPAVGTAIGLEYCSRTCSMCGM